MTRKSLAQGALAYSLWGVAPVYWKLLAAVSPVEVIAHRAVWAVFAFICLANIVGQGPHLRSAVRDVRIVGMMALSAALLSSNWLMFVWATVNGHLLDVSLGYFINPLLSVALGTILLGERLRRLQWLAIALASIGVAVLAWHVGHVPWISLFLAVTFGLYGLVRKTARIEAYAGSAIETAVMVPVALIYLAAHHGGAIMHDDPHIVALLLGTGIVTAVPLAMFTTAARALPLSVLGFLQYLAPTGQFLLAVLAYGEPLALDRLHAFMWIWAGLIVFSIDLVNAGRSRAR